MIPRPAVVVLAVTAVCVLLFPGDLSAGLELGLARRDITPDAPLRLSGYGNRAVPSQGVDTPLHVRALALRETGGPVHLLLSVDTIGFSAALTQEVLQAVEARHGVSRSRLAICCTHSHTAPHLSRGLDNLFSTPLTDEERAAATAYTDRVRDECVAAAGDALAALAPGRLFLLTGRATFARNRRVLKEGVWTGFGENPEGPVDHSLPVLAITAADGQTLRGLIFNYACHCTTFGGDYNRVNGDWAGYAAEYLEAAYPGTIALCAIGCGADQNPERDPQRALDIARMQGRQITEEVQRLLREGPRREITAAPRASFGFAGLPIDRPSVEDLKKALEDRRPQVRRHAEVMLDIHARMGRLPETYPMPIQVWRFADQFAMVFLGGEVCVDYAHRIRRELTPKLASPPAEPSTDKDAPQPVWVTAYANDVFGYVASERMRAEGGYEVDFSMIYYLQPGRWSSGTEEVILRRVHELFEQRGGDEPLSVNDALQTFTLPEGLEIEVVAAEPLIADPVNFAVDARGRLWVVEMGDYPRGAPDESGWSPPARAGRKPWDGGEPGGRIKVLADTDGDGRYDAATTFLDGLRFPTGVFPWRDGVLISCAPDILFARDDDGDGRADHREVLFTGFVEENPQHRVNGFEYGLDGWLYLASGASNGRITAVRTGETVDVSGRDIRLHPDTGRIEPVSGRSQYGRCRDDFGNWFGNTNSEPLFQFVIEDRCLRRNPFVPAPAPRAFLTDPPRAPPVYPTSRTVDRFNDLFAANRFTSACSPCVFRDQTFAAAEPAAGREESVFVCEPVHNLVSRLLVRREGIVFTASRAPTEQQSEFLSSTDPWFRPVRLMTAPDGCLWVCDMYRHVIEHPQWIPEAWQARLNLSAGADRGRIYRVRRRETPPRTIDNLAVLTDAQLVAQLAEPNGWRRDAAQRLLLERADRSEARLVGAIRSLAETHPSPAVRTQALWTLAGLVPEIRSEEALRDRFLTSDDPELVIQGLRVFGLPGGDAPEKARSAELAAHPDPRVRFETILAAGDNPDPDTQLTVLRSAALRDAADPWLRAALLSSASQTAVPLLREVLADLPPSSHRETLVEGLIATALGPSPLKGIADVLTAVAPPAEEIHAPASEVAPWQLAALASCLDVLGRQKQSLALLEGRSEPQLQGALRRVAPILDAARTWAGDPEAPLPVRTAAVRLLARRGGETSPDRECLIGLLTPQQPPEVQLAAIERLAELGAAEPLLRHLSRLGPQRQAAIESALLQHRELTQQLLGAVRAGDVPPASLSAATRSALVNHRDAAVRAAAAELFGTLERPSAANVSLRLERVTALSGDAGRGQVVFEKRCSVCHRLQGIGTDVGPQLGALTNKSAEYLLTAILDVNRSVEPRYRSCTVLLVDGRLQTGLVVEETATSLTLATADGRQHPLLRRDIEELVLTGLSFMPEGLERDLSDQDLADVVAFVQQAQ